jgi:nicotinate phosphoribosyltransferase
VNLADVIYDQSTPGPEVGGVWKAFDPLDATRYWTQAGSTPGEDLLVPIFKNGARVYQSPPIFEMQSHVRQQLSFFGHGVKRFVYPHLYPVGVEAGLHQTKLELIEKARQRENSA